MFNIPIAFIIYKRLNTTERVFRIIQLIKPKKIYLIADGPKSDSESTLCKNVRSFVESNIDWDCQTIKIYSENNLGCAKRVQTGLDYVFRLEQMAIILEDDTLPNPSFFSFAKNFCLDMLRMRMLHIFPVVTCIRIFLRQKNHTVSLQLSISGAGQHGNVHGKNTILICPPGIILKRTNSYQNGVVPVIKKMECVKYLICIVITQILGLGTLNGYTHVGRTMDSQ